MKVCLKISLVEIPYVCCSSIVISTRNMGSATWMKNLSPMSTTSHARHLSGQTDIDASSCILLNFVSFIFVMPISWVLYSGRIPYTCFIALLRLHEVSRDSMNTIIIFKLIMCTVVTVPAMIPCLPAGKIRLGFQTSDWHRNYPFTCTDPATKRHGT